MTVAQEQERMQAHLSHEEPVREQLVLGNPSMRDMAHAYPSPRTRTSASDAGDPRVAPSPAPNDGGRRLLLSGQGGPDAAEHAHQGRGAGGGQARQAAVAPHRRQGPGAPCGVAMGGMEGLGGIGTEGLWFGSIPSCL